MNTGQNAVRNKLATRAGVLRHFPKMALGVFVATFLASSAFAQYGGGGTGMGTGSPGTPGYVAPKNGYGSGEAVRIGVRAGAGVGVLFLAFQYPGGGSGGVQQTGEGVRPGGGKKNKGQAL